MKIKTAEERLKEKFWNGKYYEIHSGDFSEILDMMNEHAVQFIELAADTAINKGKFNKNLVNKEKEELLKQVK